MEHVFSNNRSRSILAVVLLFAAAVFLLVQQQTRTAQKESADVQQPLETQEVITLAGGCFWCTEAYLQETPGVIDAVSGYAGGDAQTANYKAVSGGTTSHKEAVQVTFDPSRVSLEEILSVFWSHIDPTDDKGQFADRGQHYTTAIFYHTDAQREVAEASKQALEQSGLFDAPIATLIVPLTTFFRAEEYHQDFYKKSSEHYERYKEASGRAEFIEENWAKEAALMFLDANTQTSEEASSGYQDRAWSQTEIDTAIQNLPQDIQRILVEEGTEPPFRNAYWDHKEEGIYVDVVTRQPLFSSTHKYDSHTGWPSFYATLSEASLVLKVDLKLGYPRTEVRSQSGHLGHLFDDGPEEHGGKRYCINSRVLQFVPKAEMEVNGYGNWLYLFE